MNEETEINVKSCILSRMSQKNHLKWFIKSKLIANMFGYYLILVFFFSKYEIPYHTG